jgi:hypothetical protein
VQSRLTSTARTTTMTEAEDIWSAVIIRSEVVFFGIGAWGGDGGDGGGDGSGADGSGESGGGGEGAARTVRDTPG